MRPASETIGFVERASFELRGVQAMHEHYVTTVRHWLGTFEQRYPQFHAVGAAG